MGRVDGADGEQLLREQCDMSDNEEGVQYLRPAGSDSSSNWETNTWSEESDPMKNNIRSWINISKRVKKNTFIDIEK